jgi:hypothetical protein
MGVWAFLRIANLGKITVNRYNQGVAPYQHPMSGSEAPSETSSLHPIASIWYVIQQADGTCSIQELPAGSAAPDGVAQWGPLPSQGEAIARRVGLIRAGKCLPV